MILDCRWVDRRVPGESGCEGGGGFGIIWDIVMGVLGALLGGWISAQFLHIGSVTGINLISILIATLDSAVLLVIFRLLRRL